MRAADHLQDAGALDAIRTYARGQHAIVCVSRFAPPHAITLYDTDMPPVIDVEADARVVHTHWGGRRRRILQRRWFLVEDCG